MPPGLSAMMSVCGRDVQYPRGKDPLRTDEGDAPAVEYEALLQDDLGHDLAMCRGLFLQEVEGGEPHTGVEILPVIVHSSDEVYSPITPTITPKIGYWQSLLGTRMSA